MDNQHQKISGYRDLTQVEIDLMNRIKEKEAEVLELHREVGRYLVEQYASGIEEAHRQEEAHAVCWHATARNDIETGFMKLVRAVAQPQPKTNKG